MNDELENTGIKVILRAGDIPDRSTVTKRTGQKPYTIKDKIVIYPYLDGNGKPPQQVIEAKGVKFLVSDDGSINAVGDDVELVWYTDKEELLDYLQYHDEVSQ